MILGRRDFLAGAGAIAVSSRSLFANATQAPTRAGIFPPSVRADFPPSRPKPT